MDDEIDTDTLLNLLDDDFEDPEENLDNETNNNEGELLDTEELLLLINNDDNKDVKDDNSIKQGNNHPEDTPNEIQEEMLRLQKQLNALQEKLLQKNCAEKSLPCCSQSPNREKNSEENKSPMEETAQWNRLDKNRTTPESRESSLQKNDNKRASPAKEMANRKKEKRLIDVPLELPVEDLVSKKRGSRISLTKIQEKKNLLQNDSEVHTGLTDSSDDESSRNPLESGTLSEEGRQIKKRIAHSATYRDKEKVLEKLTWKRDNRLSPRTTLPTEFVPIKAKMRTTLPTEVTPIKTKTVAEKSEDDVFSGIRIINPLVSSLEMKNKMEGRKLLRLSLLENYIRGGDIEGDWVTIGVLIQKSVPKKSNKNGKTFSIWTLNDLRVLNKSVNLFLFGEVHLTHWKTSVGTVVGILNPSIMQKRDGFSKSEGLSISVDHSGKILVIGSSKDFGHCKARKKDGSPCTMIVNVNLCAVCEYHVQAEYKKMSGKRLELQTMSGVQPKSLKNQILNKQGVMYGGQLYTCPRPEPVRKKGTKDKLTLESLKLKHKALEFETQSKPKITLNHLTEKENETVNGMSTTSEFLSEKLCEPTAGSRNLLRHLAKEDHSEKILKGNIKSITPKELLQMHTRSLQSRNLITKPTKVALPQLGRGLKPGDCVSLDFSFSRVKSDMAKLRAVAKLQSKGPIEPENPNAVKKVRSPEAREKIEKRVAEDFQKEGDKNDQELDQPPSKRNRLCDVDINSEKIRKILERKSSHAHEVDEEEAERQEKYFHNLERKEAIEQKMESIREMKCDVVSCKTCEYTAHQAADVCLYERHPLQRHKAIKRFFSCSDCHHRTWAFTRIPSKACRNCGGSNFERTTMMKPKRGPQLENEKLMIRGDEAKFIK